MATLGTIFQHVTHMREFSLLVRSGVRVTNVARLLRGLLPVLAASAAATAVALPAAAAAPPAVTRSSQWWLSSLRVPAASRAAPEAGKGVTVAVLSTGVDAKHQDLAGTVIGGPDFSKTGRAPGGSYWGAEGTAVASLIAGHGHGSGGSAGITGVAPGAKILSLQVTLEYDDPLNSAAAITGNLPAAIAAGIRYAVGHGATVIALPLDPGTLGAAPAGDPAAGGSAAERAAVSFALARNVILVAPAGDNGAATDSVNYPAAYPGVIAVGATSRTGELAPFTNTGSYVALTAPGSGTTPGQALSGGMTADPAAGLLVAAPDGGYEPLASSDMSAALTAGVAALIRSRYPWLTVAEVTQAIEHGATPPPGAAGNRVAAGWGHGALDAGAALTSAAAIAAAHPAPAPPATQPTAPAVAPATTGTTHRAAAGQSDPGGLLRSLVVDLAVAAGVLIACLVAAITLTRLRRRARRAKSDVRRAGRPARIVGRARHARGQQATRTAPVPARVVIWPSTPALPASGASGSSQAPAPLGKHGGAYRRQRPAGNPPWQPAAPPRSPGSLPMMLPAQPALESAEQPLAPWEQSPAEFATAPAIDDVAPWPVSNTGPMYVWNPAATGPIVAIGNEEGEGG
jgi:subtilisin family serine protease